MPIYEFKCNDCSYQEDLIRKISEPTTILCPKCDSQNFVKQVSAPNFKLKGSGWYETDFKNKNNSKETKNNSKETKNNNKIKESTSKKLGNKMFKKNILTGLLVLIPIVLTLWVLITLTQFLDQILVFIPNEFKPDILFGGAIPGYGVIVTLVIVFLTGVIANNFFGKKFISVYEYVLNKVPVINSIYKGIKQVSDTLLSNSGKAFSKAVLIEFPNAGTYTFAFVTGVPNDQIAKHLKGKFVNVYVPTTPNPTSGYTLIVPTKKIIEIDLSVDQVLKYVISMGVSTSDEQFVKKNKKRKKVENK